MSGENGIEHESQQPTGQKKKDKSPSQLPQNSNDTNQLQNSDPGVEICEPPIISA